MKLDINDLTRELAKQPQELGIKPIPPDKDFLTGFADNVRQIMGVLDAVGVKDIFIEKAREELQHRLFGGRTRNTVTYEPPTPKPTPKETAMRNPFKLDIDRLVTLGLAWLDRFIERNGDMPLSEFKKHMEKQRGDIVKMIKDLGIGV